MPTAGSMFFAPFFRSLIIVLICEEFHSENHQNIVLVNGKSQDRKVENLRS